MLMVRGFICVTSVGGLLTANLPESVSAFCKNTLALERFVQLMAGMWLNDVFMEW